MPNYKYPNPAYYTKCNQHVNNCLRNDSLYFMSLDFFEYNLLSFMGTEVQEKAINKLIQHLIKSIEQKTKLKQIIKQYGL